MATTKEQDQYFKENIIRFFSKFYDYETSLRTLCHHKDCNKIRECPEGHSKCKNKLNIITAIAWEMAEQARKLYKMSKYFPEDLDTIFERTTIILRFITAYMNVLDYHQSNRKVFYIGGDLECDIIEFRNMIHAPR